ncbi:hypothetical protein [Candidatus Poriferisodalis sp.]|uniref:hypothetical protein n=1 Tax=Candidatus Poriferisodalis sp. TaxID=3101277 RepID=UPI003B021D1F
MALKRAQAEQAPSQHAEQDMGAGSWPYKPTAVWRRLVAVIGLVAFTALCVVALVSLVVAAAAVGALMLEALIG